MIPSTIALLTLLLTTAACAARATPSQAGGQPASDATKPSAAEYVIYSTVLAEVNYEVRVAERTEEGRPCDSTFAPFCDPRRFSEKFQEALRDYAVKRRDVTVLPRLPIPARPVAQWRAPAGEASHCWPMPTSRFSRVGFNRDSTHAVVSYSESAGPGPFPGCGYLSSQLLLLQRAESGEWRIAVVALESIT